MKPAQWERATAPTLADIEVLAARPGSGCLKSFAPKQPTC